MPFPTTLVESRADLVPLLEVQNIDEIGRKALDNLWSQGYVMYAGLSPEDLEEVTVISNQEDVREYALRDSTERFVNQESGIAWHASKGGRAPFLLKPIKVPAVFGYSWTGFESKPSPEKAQADPELHHFIERYPGTSAFRLDPRARGKHIARLLAIATVSATRALYVPDIEIGLESWASNVRAIGAYKGADAEIVLVRDTMRPTQQSTIWPDGVRPDVRFRWNRMVPEIGDESWASDQETTQRFISLGAQLVRLTNHVRLLEPGEDTPQYINRKGERQRPDTRVFMGFPSPLQLAA